MVTATSATQSAGEQHAARSAVWDVRHTRWAQWLVLSVRQRGRFESAVVTLGVRRARAKAPRASKGVDQMD